MKIIISAFECNPLRGSDSFVGWSYAINAAKYNDIYVVTRTTNKNDIEKYCASNDVPQNIHFIYIDQSLFFTKILYKINHHLGFLGSYVLWQGSAFRIVKKINKTENFDLVHHISIADFRVAGKMWKLDIPFIYGPVGGAQVTPKPFKDYIQGHEGSEKIREFLNDFMISLPGYRRALKKASRIFVSNEETYDAIRKILKDDELRKVKIKCELCVDESYLVERSNIDKELTNKDTIHIIVSGRLIYRKGLELLIDVMTKLKSEQKYVLDIYGTGPEEKKIKKLLEEKELNDVVRMHGKVDFKKLQEVYLDGDIFVLPSIRETTGTAVIEAMANKLPVVSFKQNGVKKLVEDKAGILVPIIDKQQSIDGMAEAIKKLIENPELRKTFGEAGYRIIFEEYTWKKRAMEMNELYHILAK